MQLTKSVIHVKAIMLKQKTEKRRAREQNTIEL
jgi:hypothetical protein